jgi:YHS domain-containing protein
MNLCPSLLLLGVLLSLVPARAEDRVLVNVDRSGLALQGHDPVAFFTEGKPVRGDERFTSRHQGATYRFASEEHRTAFEREPQKYAPQFGGFCAWAVSNGYTAPVKVEAFEIVAGRLLLQYDRGARDLFDRDRTGNLAKADANWPGLVEKKGKKRAAE